MPNSRIAVVLVLLLIAAPAWAEPQLRRVVLSSGGVGCELRFWPELGQRSFTSLD